MRRLASILTICLGLSAIVPLHAQQRVLDRIVAVVDREIILESELNAQIDFFVFNNRVDPQTPDLKRQVLEVMMNEKLILAKAVEDSIVVSDEDVNEQLDVLIQQRARQVGSEQRLAELYGMTVGRMKREFRDDMRKQLMVSKLQQKRFADVQVTRREVEEFLEEYRDSLPMVPEEVELYHIFVLPKAGADVKAAVRARAQAILDTIGAGGDFAEFAKRYSQDPGSASLGGDLGFIRRGQLVKEFEEVVFSLREQELSRIVETSFGFHVIQLLERRGESVRARHILFKVEQDQSAEENATAFLNSLRDSISAGASFSELAKRHSEDSETAPIGGYLGKFTLDQLDESLVATLRQLNPGEISEPLRVSYGMSFGYHIVYLKRRIPGHPMNLSEDWKRVEQMAASFKRTKEYQAWITQLKQDIYWDIRI